MNSEQRAILSIQDAKFEPLVVELIEQGQLKAEDLIISPKGLFARGYLKDVAHCALKKGERKEYVQIDICREGLYDMLPKAIFHAQKQADGFDTIDRYIEQSKREQLQEAEARKFFLPVEQSFYEKRLAIEQRERDLTTGFQNPLQKKIFQNFWENTEDLQGSFQDILLYLLPLSHIIAGNDEALANCLSTMLNEQIKIIRVASKKQHFGDAIHMPLGNTHLGVNLIIGEEVASELETLVVMIGPVDLDSISDYLSVGQKAKLLKVVCDCFIPFEADYVFHVMLKENSDGFQLNKEKDTARLGYSSFLA